MTTYQWRRFLILWTPTYLTGITLMGYSATLTTSLNGFTLLGALIALTGLMAAARDTKERS